MKVLDVTTLRPDLTDEGAQEARATLTRWQDNPRAWSVFCRNAHQWRHNGYHPVFCFPVKDEGYFRVMEAAQNVIVGDAA